MSPRQPQDVGYGGIRALQPPVGRGQPRTGAPCAAPQPDTAPHKRPLFPSAARGGGPRGWCGRWCHEAALPRPHPVPIPSPSRPHPVPIPWPCRGRTAVTHPAGTGGGGPGQGEDGALPCDELTASSSPRDEVRGCGQHRGSPDVPCPPQRHLQLCWLPGVGRGVGGRCSHQLPPTPKPGSTACTQP